MAHDGPVGGGSTGPVPGAPGTGPLDSGARVSPASRAPELEDVQDEEAETPVEDMEARIAELEDRWLRSAAELDNFRKRIARDAERIRTDERDRVAGEWLPIVDNLDLALRHARAAGAAESAIVEGVRAVRDQAIGLLARLGFPRHDEVGVPFDPKTHEAMGTVENAEVPAGTVVETVRPGYGEGRHQLRPASVIVSTTPG
ncbi:protein GrpE [Sphaerisporangium krabiense]|nr:protein GrpE [Sphaerisporangium krabiense]